MEFFSLENLLALLTLTLLEIVLGFDNIIVLSLIVGKLEKEKQDVARRLGMIGAMVMRVVLLLSISAIMLLTSPFIVIAEKSFSGRDLVLLFGAAHLRDQQRFHCLGDMAGNDQVLFTRHLGDFKTGG